MKKFRNTDFINIITLMSVLLAVCGIAPVSVSAVPADIRQSVEYITNPNMTESLEFHSYGEFAAFVNENANYIPFSTEIYDENYFENYMLSLLYITTDSSASTYFPSVDFSGNNIDFEVTRLTRGETDDIVSWFLVFEGGSSYTNDNLNVTLKEDLSDYLSNVTYYEYFYIGTDTPPTANIPPYQPYFTKVGSLDELKNTALYSKYNDSFFDSNFLLAVNWFEPQAVRTHNVTSVISRNDCVDIELSEFWVYGVYPDMVTPYCAVIELPKRLSDKEYSASYNKLITISTAQELKALADDVNNGNTYEAKTIVLVRDIDLSSVCGKDINGESVSWTPIGANDNHADEACDILIEPNIFNGVFDGNGCTINGLYIDYNKNTDIDPSRRYFGLFGYTGEKAVIKNLTTDGSVSVYTDEPPAELAAVEPLYDARGYIGGITGFSNGALIENCHNKADIEAIGDFHYIGGIAGVSVDAEISRCSNSGDISGSHYLGFVFAGGICGTAEYDDTAKISSCFNTGSVSGSYASGITAMAMAAVTDCYSIGSIICRATPYDTESNFFNIQNCYRLDTANDEMYPNIEPKTAAQFASGEVAYLLGDAWGQKIGVENYPVLGGDKVYFDNGSYTNIPPRNKSLYEITGLRITDISGNEIDCPTENTSFIAETDIKKTEERAEKDYLFVAVYDTDGALISLNYVKAKFETDGECSFGFNIPAQEKAIGSIKAFVWNTFNSMEPLAETKTLSFTVESAE